MLKNKDGKYTRCFKTVILFIFYSTNSVKDEPILTIFDTQNPYKTLHQKHIYFIRLKSDWHYQFIIFWREVFLQEYVYQKLLKSVHFSELLRNKNNIVFNIVYNHAVHEYYMCTVLYAYYITYQGPDCRNFPRQCQNKLIKMIKLTKTLGNYRDSLVFTLPSVLWQIWLDYAKQRLR